jgi:hypothetical protein
MLKNLITCGEERGSSLYRLRRFSWRGDLCSPWHNLLFLFQWCPRFLFGSRGHFWWLVKSPSISEKSIYHASSFYPERLGCEAKALKDEKTSNLVRLNLYLAFLSCPERVALGPVAFGRRHTWKIHRLSRFWVLGKSRGWILRESNLCSKYVMFVDDESIHELS